MSKSTAAPWATPSGMHAAHSRSSRLRQSGHVSRHVESLHTQILACRRAVTARGSRYHWSCIFLPPMARFFTKTKDGWRPSDLSVCYFRYSVLQMCQYSSPVKRSSLSGWITRHRGRDGMSPSSSMMKMTVDRCFVAGCFATHLLQILLRSTRCN